MSAFCANQFAERLFYDLIEFGEDPDGQMVQNRSKIARKSLQINDLRRTRNTVLQKSAL